MAQWIWALIAVIGIVLIVAIVLIINRQRRTISLQQRFGPEYARTVESATDRRAGEASLEDRTRRRSQLSVVPLAEPARLRYTEQWRGLQEHFVDRPAEAVDAASSLLTRVMEDCGYPVGEFDQQADLISVDHPHVVENYRVAHEIHLRNQAKQASTEDLREAMLRYRSLFDDLLHPGQDNTGPDTDTDGQATHRSRVGRVAGGRDPDDPVATGRDSDEPHEAARHELKEEEHQ